MAILDPGRLDRRAVGVGDGNVGVGDRYPRPATGGCRGIVRATAIGIVGVEIEDRRSTRYRDERVRLVTPKVAVEYEDCNGPLCADGRGRAEPDLLDRSLIVGLRGKTGQLEDAGEWIVRLCKNSEWQRAVNRQHVTGLLAPDVDLREGDKAAVEVVYVAVGIGDPDRRTAGGELCPIVVAHRRRIVEIEIDVRREEITERRGRRGQCVAIDPVGRVADEGEQLGGIRRSVLRRSHCRSRPRPR
jgi:hypothetical protein